MEEMNPAFIFVVINNGLFPLKMTAGKKDTPLARIYL